MTFLPRLKGALTSASLRVCVSHFCTLFALAPLLSELASTLASWVSRTSLIFRNHLVGRLTALGFAAMVPANERCSFAEQAS